MPTQVQRAHQGRAIDVEAARALTVAIAGMGDTRADIADTTARIAGPSSAGRYAIGLYGNNNSSVYHHNYVGDDGDEEGGAYSHGYDSGAADDSAADGGLRARHAFLRHSLARLGQRRVACEGNVAELLRVLSDLNSRNASLVEHNRLAQEECLLVTVRGDRAGDSAAECVAAEGRLGKEIAQLEAAKEEAAVRLRIATAALAAQTERLKKAKAAAGKVLLEERRVDRAADRIAHGGNAVRSLLQVE